MLLLARRGGTLEWLRGKKLYCFGLAFRLRRGVVLLAIDVAAKLDSAPG